MATRFRKRDPRVYEAVKSEVRRLIKKQRRAAEARYSIMYQYRDGEPEEIDTAQTEDEAASLLQEYKLSHGRGGGKVWVESGFGKKIMERTELTGGQRRASEASVQVKNLATGEIKVYTGISPMEAVIAAYAQSKGDYNTWDYQKRYARLVRKGQHVYTIDDWSVFQDGRPIETATREGYGGLTFDQWMQQVDQYISRKAGGMTSYDLADIAYRDLYDAGESPQEAAKAALRNEGFPGL